LRNRCEQELAGYRDAQDYVFQPDWRPLNAGLILHLHRLLFAHTAMPGGAFKTEDNLVVDRSPDGGATVRFKLAPAARTPFSSSTPLRTATGEWPACWPMPCSPSMDTPSNAT
jgi:hypothetical protein